MVGSQSSNPYQTHGNVARHPTQKNAEQLNFIIFLVKTFFLLQRGPKGGSILVDAVSRIQS